MRKIIRKILNEEIIKDKIDVFEIIVLQDIINSNTRIVDDKAIKSLIHKTFNFIKKCTNNKEGVFYYQVRNIQHPTFNTDIIFHRITFIGHGLSPYLNCVKEKGMKMIRVNHDKGEINLYSNINKSSLNQYWDKMPENSTYRSTWKKKAFFDFYHQEMIKLTLKDKIKIEA